MCHYWKPSSKLLFKRNNMAYFPYRYRFKSRKEGLWEDVKFPSHFSCMTLSKSCTASLHLISHLCSKNASVTRAVTERETVTFSAHAGFSGDRSHCHYSMRYSSRVTHGHVPSRVPRCAQADTAHQSWRAFPSPGRPGTLRLWIPGSHCHLLSVALRKDSVDG